MAATAKRRELREEKRKLRGHQKQRKQLALQQQKQQQPPGQHLGLPTSVTSLGGPRSSGIKDTSLFSSDSTEDSGSSQDSDLRDGGAGTDAAGTSRSAPRLAKRHKDFGIYPLRDTRYVPPADALTVQRKGDHMGRYWVNPSEPKQGWDRTVLCKS